MNVFALRPKGEYMGGMALVAADNYSQAIEEYAKNGEYGEEVYNKEIELQPTCYIPIVLMVWHGEQGIIFDNFYIE